MAATVLANQLRTRFASMADVLIRALRRLAGTPIMTFETDSTLSPVYFVT